jgi:serine/threonine protein kinase/Tfp pilus assembly protein PilF
MEGRPLRLETCLPHPSAANYLPTLVELVLIEMEFAWRARRDVFAAEAPPRVEDYLRRFPLLERTDLLTQLVEHEYQMRVRFDRAPSPEEYRRRFSGIALPPQFDVAAPSASPTATASAETDRESANAPAPLGPGTSDVPPVGVRAARPEGAASTTVRGSVDAPEAPGSALPTVDLHVEKHGSLSSSGDGATNSTRRYPRIGRFIIKEEIARGGLGRVLLGHDPLLGRNVALKEMLPRSQEAPELVARFHEEAQITGQLEHPHIVPIHELGVEANGCPYYAMKLIRGRTLHAAIREYHAMPTSHPQRALRLRELLRAFVSVCHAVAYAHSRHVLHRDLKPANILIGDYGEVQVVDWGLAKVLNQQVEEQRQSDSELFNDTSAVHPAHRAPEMQTTTGSVVGTPVYMSPEQARGDIETLQPASDIYSLGAVMYEILVGQRPFTGETRGTLLDKVIAGQFPRPRAIRPEISKALEAICLRAMAHSPADRYRSAADLAEDISRWEAREPVWAYREPWPQRAMRWVRRHKSLCLAAAVGLSACVLTLGVWRWRDGVRVAVLREQTLPLILNGQAALSGGDLQAAQLRLTEAAAKIGEEIRLTDLQSNIERLLGETDERLRQQAEQEAAREKLRQLRQHREDALFYGSLFTGFDLEENLARTEAAARDGLALFGVDGAEPGLPALDERLYTGEQQREVRRLCCELVLMRVGAMGRGLAARIDAPRQALQLLERARPMGLSDKAYHLQRAWCFQAEGDTIQSESARRQAEAAEPEGVFDYFLAGLESYYASDFAGAAAEFDAGLRHEPGEFWSEYFLALCLVREIQDDSARAEAALAHLNACLARRDDFAWCYLLRGYVYAVLKRDKDAHADFARAADLGADEYALLVNRGAAQVAAGRLDAAERDLLRAREINGDRYQAYLNLSEVYRLQNREAEAALILDRLSSLHSDLPDAYRQRALLAVARGNDEAALAFFRQAIELARGDRVGAAKNQLERGRILHRQGELAEADEAYTAALRDWPAGLEAYLLRGLTRWDARREDEALADFDRFLANADPRRVAPELLSLGYRKRGLLRVQRSGALAGEEQRRMLAAAIDDFTHALAQPAEDLDRQELALIRARRGWAYLLPSPALASVDFEAAVQLDPQSADAYNGRGFARVALADYRRAVGDAEEAVRLHAHAGDLANAACIYAQAAAQVLQDSQAEQPEQVAEDYRAAAMRLLHQAIEMNPPDQRREFAELTLVDSALDPIRESAEFAQLQQKFLSETPPMPPSKNE